MSVPLRLTSGRPVAFAQGRSLVVPVTSRNYFAQAHGFSVDAGVLAQAIRLGCISIEFRHRDGRCWRVAIQTFMEHAQRIDFGHGPKFVADEFLYHEVGGVQLEPRQIADRDAPNAEPAPSQTAANMMQPGGFGEDSDEASSLSGEV